MFARALLGSSFAASPDLIRAHAAGRTNHPTLIEGEEIAAAFCRILASGSVRRISPDRI